MKNTPDKVQLTIKAEERLSPDMLGIELGVKILDQSSEPVSGQPFKVFSGSDVLIEGTTDEQGEYSGQRVFNVQEGTQKKVFLVLEGSAVTDWKIVGIGNEAGKKSQESDNDTTEGDEAADTEDTLEEILNGNRTVKKGEEISLRKEIYRVTGDITVEEGGRLIIESGAILEFEEGTGLICKGILVAVGTREAPIIFKPSSEGWDNITLVGKGTLGSHLEYCVIEGGQGRNYDYYHNNYGENGYVVLLRRPEKAADDKSCGGGLLLIATDPIDSNLQEDSTNSPSVREEMTLRFLIIKNNSSKRSGGGIYCHHSSPTIEKCRIESNQSMFGGGISLAKSKSSIRSSRILNNIARRGGGIDVSMSKIVMEDCLIDANCTENGGGSGVHCTTSIVKIVSSKIQGNRSTGTKEVSGAGIKLKMRSELEIVDSEITENESDGEGGAISSGGDCKLIIIRSKINRNRGKDSIVWCYLSEAEIIDSEIAFNSCSRNVISFNRHRLKIDRSRIKGNYVQRLPVLDIEETDYTVVDSEIQEK